MPNKEQALAQKQKETKAVKLYTFPLSH